MRDFYFFTSKPITAQDCYEMLKKEIKNIEGTADPNEVNLWINAKSRSFLWFYNDRLTDFSFGGEEELEKEKKRIPIQDPYINHFETHRSIDVKRVISVLMKIYPEIYIEEDDCPPWYGTAQEYLDAKFHY